MSEIRVDRIKDEAGTGAIEFTEGATIPSGKTLSGAGSISVNSTGTAAGLSGTPEITVSTVTGVAATFTGAVSIGGTLTYEDVTNVDSIGVITARSGVHFGTAAAGTLVIGDADGIGIGTNNPNNALLQVESDTGTARVKFRSGDSNASALYLQNVTTGDGDSDGLKLELGGDEEAYIWMMENADMNFGTNNTERLKIDNLGNFRFSNAALVENGNINTTARNGTQAVDLADGMVHNFTTNSAGTWTPNFRVNSTTSLDSVMGTGDVISVTMIVAKGATTHFSNAIQVDGSAVTPEWLGGAPTDGGASGTFDIYSYTIMKTGSAAFSAFAAVNTYE